MNVEIKIKKGFSFNRIVLIICFAVYILYYLINANTGDSISTMILLGADYKTFTLGLGEFFRLITSAFGHYSIIHLLGNMISLYSLGSFIELFYGSKRYLLYLFGGILLGSLTSGILNVNSIVSGISSALYTFFVMLILYLIVYRKTITSNFIFIIFINLGLNFLPNVSWQSHLGGAMAGIIFFFIDYYKQTNNQPYRILFIILLVISIIFLFFKYYSTKKEIIDYAGTDFAYVEYLDKHFPFLKEHYENKIYNYYVEKGNQYE